MSEKYHPLADMAELAITFEIDEISRRGGPTQADYEHARGFAWTLGEKGDTLLYPGKKKGETAKLFSGFVRALAVLAFQPGGVPWNGRRFTAIANVEGQAS